MSPHGLSLRCQPYGQHPHTGDPVDIITLQNKSSKQYVPVTVTVLTYGGIINEVYVGEEQTPENDVCLGHPSLNDWVDGMPYMNCLVGRYANRIAKGKFTLDDTTYDQLEINNPPNHLHGGNNGFGTKVLYAELIDRSTSTTETPYVGVKLSKTSHHDEAHYPAALHYSVTYKLYSDSSFRMEYDAEIDSDSAAKSTVVNLTNHTYWQLQGHTSAPPSVAEHTLQLECPLFLPIDTGLIPTGEVADVTDSSKHSEAQYLNFTKARTLKDCIQYFKGEGMQHLKGVDHCLCMQTQSKPITTTSTANPPYGVSVDQNHIATLHDPQTQRTMKMYTTKPAIQIYTGNFLEQDMPGKHKAKYQQHAGVCMETQYYPDSPNHKHFPSCVLRKGEKYHHSTTHVFSVGA